MGLAVGLGNGAFVGWDVGSTVGSRVGYMVGMEVLPVEHAPPSDRSWNLSDQSLPALHFSTVKNSSSSTDAETGISAEGCQVKVRNRVTAWDKEWGLGEGR